MRSKRLEALVGALVITAFSSAAPAAEEHPFADALPAPLVVLEGLPGDGALPEASAATDPGPAARSAGTEVRGAPAPYRERPRKLGLAAGEVVLLEVLPWSVNRYLSQSKFAYISVDTVRQNLETGFTYDRDSFHTDQSSHPFHGSLFFNAARENGYSFWESGAFAFAGSFVWETGMEAEPPAINDLVNTTLGGMDRGEIAHRLSRLLLDNTKHGAPRFWRELGAAALNPMGFFNRLIDGDLTRHAENPPDRYPTRFVVDLEGAYRHRGGDLAGEDTDQGALEVRARYGDPFDGERHKPYEYFDVTVDLTYPATAFLSRAESRGILVDGPLGGPGGNPQRLALFLHFTYFDNGPISYGAEAFDLSHLLLVPLGHDAELRTEAGVGLAPMAAMQVDYTRLGTAVYGRSFDYGPAGILQASARIRRHEIDLAKVAYGIVYQAALDGIGKHSRLQTFSAEARAPLFGDRFSAGAGWSWSDRMTTYGSLPTVQKSGSSLRLFGAVTWADTPVSPPPAAPPSSSGPPEAPEAGPFEVSIFGGAMFGTRVLTLPSSEVRIANAGGWGLRAAWAASPSLRLEANWSHAASDLLGRDPSVDAPYEKTGTVDTDAWDLDALYDFGGKATRGSLGLGLGAMQISPTLASLSDSETRFTLNVAAGVRQWFGSHLALRLDGRWRWRDGKTRIGTIVCDGECKPFTTNWYSSAELTGGVTYRF